MCRNPLSRRPETVRPSGNAAAEHSRTWIVLTLATMLSAYFFSYFLRSGIPGTIFSQLQADLSLSASGVTAISAMYVYIYGGMQIFVGLAADRLGGKRTLLIGWTAMAVGASLFPLSHSLLALFATRALTGFGSSFMFLCLLKEIDRILGHERFATMAGVVLAVGYLGAIAGTLPFERLVAAFGWRETLLGIDAVILLNLALGAWLLGWKDHHRPVRQRNLFSPILKTLANRRCWPLFCYSLVNFPIYFNMQSVLGKKILEDHAGFSSSTAATVVLCMISVTALVTFSSGAALRLTGHRRKPFMLANPLILLTAVLAMLGGVFWGAPGWIFVAAYILLAFAMITSPANLSTMKELNDPAFVAVSIAVLNGMNYVGAAIMGNLCGVILDRFQEQTVEVAGTLIYPPEAYAALFGIFAGLLVVSFLGTLLFMPETRGIQSAGEVVDMDDPAHVKDDSPEASPVRSART